MGFLMPALGLTLIVGGPQGAVPQAPGTSRPFFLTRPLQEGRAPVNPGISPEPAPTGDLVDSATLPIQSVAASTARQEAWLQALAERLWSNPTARTDPVRVGPCADLPGPTTRWHACLLTTIDEAPGLDQHGPPAGDPVVWLTRQAAALARPDLLRSVRQLSAMPTPAGLAESLGRITTNRPGVDIELIRILAAAPPDVARPLLSSRLSQVFSGQASPLLVDALASGLGRIEDPSILAELYACREAPSPAALHAAGQAYASLRDRLARALRFPEIARALAPIEREFPADPELALDRAQCLVWAAAPEARAALESIAARFGTHPSSRAIQAWLEARLGQATLAHTRGEDPTPVVEKILAMARIRAGSDRRTRSIAARALFLQGLHILHQGDAEGARGLLARAVETAPSVPDQNLLYRVLWGRFGPFPLLETIWVTRGEAARALEGVLAIERALRDDPGQRFLGPPGHLLRAGTDERPLTWLPLFVARLYDDLLGDPKAAISYLEPIARELESSNLYANRELLAACHAAMGRAAHALLDAPRALQEFDRAIRTALDLERAVLLDEGQRRERRFHEYGVRSPLPDPGTLESSTATWLDATVVALRLNRAAVQATLIGDHPGALAEIRKAHARLPVDPDVRMAIALVEGRRGRFERVERLLACVEPSPERLYNRACACALIGRKRDALSLLSEHLERNLRTEGARARFRIYARQDPDLDSLRSEKAFKIMVSDE